MPTNRKSCKCCNKQKPLYEYQDLRGTADGLHTWCKQCIRNKAQKRIAEKGGLMAIKTGNKRQRQQELPFANIGETESRIEMAITEYIKQLQASKKRLKKGKMDIQIVNGRVQVTI